MGKSDYTVKIVERELLALWHEFWDRPNPTARAKRAARGGALGQVRIVRAKNKRDAADLAEEQKSRLCCDP